MKIWPNHLLQQVILTIIQAPGNLTRLTRGKRLFTVSYKNTIYPNRFMVQNINASKNEAHTFSSKNFQKLTKVYMKPKIRIDMCTYICSKTLISILKYCHFCSQNYFTNSMMTFIHSMLIVSVSGTRHLEALVLLQKTPAANCNFH